MTNEELVSLFQEGEKAYLKDLYEQNKGLIYKYARRYTNRLNPVEDLAQIGFLGLVKAVEGFDPSLGWKFTTYASKAIMGAMCRALYHTDDLSLDMPINEQEGCGTIADTITDTNAIDPEESTINKDLRRIVVTAARENLNKPQRITIKERFFQGEIKTFVAIGIRLNVSGVRSRAIYHEALRRMRQHRLIIALRREYIDNKTDFYKHRIGGLSRVKEGRGSQVELIVLEREKARQDIKKIIGV